jgi:hypothetical protein
MPQKPLKSPRTRNMYRQRLINSDGFEGSEVTPTGKTIPTRHSQKRRVAIPKLTIRLGQLTLVADKSLEEVRPQNTDKPCQTLSEHGERHREPLTRRENVQIEPESIKASDVVQVQVQYVIPVTVVKHISNGRLHAPLVYQHYSTNFSIDRSTSRSLGRIVIHPANQIIIRSEITIEGLRHQPIM